MKILLTGGGSGGHVYPLMAVAQEIRRIEDEENLVGVKLYFMAPDPYNKKLLFDYDIEYKKVFSGKIRNYFSLLNYLDIFKTFFGIIKAFWTLFTIFPDVIVAKGGYGSYPVLFVARFLRIPTIIHESDTIPGKANMIASKHATRIAVSWPQAKNYFPKDVQDRVAYTGQPVRKSIQVPAEEGAHEYLKLEDGIPTIFVLGGSQGAQIINETILEALPHLVENFQIIHQVGKANFSEVSETAKIILSKNKNASRYKVFDYLNDLALRMAAGASSVVVTRAGSTLFEIANWKRPAIIIPITKSKNDHQRANAYAYARSGGGVVLEEKNFEPSILESEITRITSDKDLARKMGEVAFKEFASPDAAKKIALETIRIALSHLK